MFCGQDEVPMNPIAWGFCLQADQKFSSQHAPAPSSDPLSREIISPSSVKRRPCVPLQWIFMNLTWGWASSAHFPRDPVSQWGDAARWLVLRGDMIQHGKCQSGSDGETTCDPATVRLTSRVSTNQVTVWASQPERLQLSVPSASKTSWYLVTQVIWPPAMDLQMPSEGLLGLSHSVALHSIII